MPKFVVSLSLSPPAVFGLPDGAKIVVPASDAPREFWGPTIDSRTGHIVGHGSMSEYRKSDAALSTTVALRCGTAEFRDNFVELTIQASDPQQAADTALAEVEALLQALSVLFGQRFSARTLSVDDERGVPQSIRTKTQKVELFKLTVYDTVQLGKRIEQATRWICQADVATRKALFYAEHAALLAEFADSLPPGPHSAFSRALAFLQLFKALTTLIGDPSSDRDYQSRCRRLGLPADFWVNRAKPLYLVRNDEDVAHYSHSMPTGLEFFDHYSSALKVLTEVLDAQARSFTGS